MEDRKSVKATLDLDNSTPKDVVKHFDLHEAKFAKNSKHHHELMYSEDDDGKRMARATLMHANGHTIHNPIKTCSDNAKTSAEDAQA